ncbi:hypothetical protein [Streptomyces sp. Da 82-17]|uniref:hypothetical protein n=1 Tax=Streptomyces sp. Da 82-17 TaxID=3377116 RepID=UPI0038D3AA16
MATPEVLTALAAPLLLSGALVYAGLDRLRQRFHVPEPNPYAIARLQQAAAELRARQAVAAAEAIVRAERDRLAPLYDTPTRPHTS